MKYESEYRKLHQKPIFLGYSLLEHRDRIKKLIDHTESFHILDYGSGKGHQYSVKKTHLYWNAKVDCYDPFYQEFSRLPDKKYDGVISTEVMEHVPEEEIDQVISEIFNKAQSFIYCSVCLSPSKKSFEDGTNVHVLLKDREWWINKFMSHNKKDIIVALVFSDLDSQNEHDSYQYPVKIF